MNVCHRPLVPMLDFALQGTGLHEVVKQTNMGRILVHFFTRALARNIRWWESRTDDRSGTFCAGCIYRSASSAMHSAPAVRIILPAATSNSRPVSIID